MTLNLLKSETGRTLIESHRGVEGDVPENSWSAIKLGHELGADLIEVDVQVSKDGVAFLHHNYKLPDGRWCGQVPWSELKELKIEDEPLPKLEEVLAWAQDEDAVLSLDLKTTFSTESSLTKEVVRLLERTDTKEDVLLLFFDHEELAQVKLAHPEVKVRALARGRFVDYADYLQKIGADCANLSYDIFRPDDIEKLHSAGIAVVLGELWNPNTNLFQTMDIDVFSHGNPVEARKILNRK
jgi:glycerophosphoryl diester phosphodiesterase